MNRESSDMANRPVEIDRKELLATLDWEIADWERVIARPGATWWALAASTVAVFFYVLNSLQFATQNIELIVSVFVTSSLVGDLLFIAGRLLMSQDEPSRKGLRFLTTKSFVSFRGSICVLAARSIILLFACKYLRATVPTVTYFPSLCFFMVQVFVFVVWFFASFFEQDARDASDRLPTPVRWFCIMLLLLVLAVAWSVFTQVSFVIGQLNVGNIGGFRIGLAATGLGYLVCRLSSALSSNPLLATLRDLRQDLAFNRIDVRSAFDEADILTAGRRLSDVFHKHITNVLVLAEKDRNDISDLRTKLGVVKTVLAKRETASSAAEAQNDEVTINALLDSCRAVASRRKKRGPEIEAALMKFKKKVAEVLMFSPEADGGIARLREKISDGLTQRDNEFESLKVESLDFQKRIQDLRDQTNVCINNLRQIQGATLQWALEKNKARQAVPTNADIEPYLGNGSMPKCPKSGVYKLTSVATNPTCTIWDHKLP